MTEISIGEFARRSRLSLKAPCRYDERGVLMPSRVDQGSGCRFSAGLVTDPVPDYEVAVAFA